MLTTTVWWICDINNQMVSNIYLSDVVRGLRCIFYELLPVHPEYAYAQTRDLKNVTVQTVNILSPKLILLIKFISKSIQLISLKTWLSILLWCAVWMLFIFIEFSSIFIIISLFGAIFSNLGQKKDGELSGYSVFNKGFTTLLGQSTGQQFDMEIRHSNYAEKEDDEDNLGADIKGNEIKGIKIFLPSNLDSHIDSLTWRRLTHMIDFCTSSHIPHI